MDIRGIIHFFRKHSSILSGVFISALIAVSVFVKKVPDVFLYVALGVFVVLQVVIIVLREGRTPPTIKVGLMGDPIAGKTCYINVLFHNTEMQQDGFENYALYGEGTRQRVRNKYEELLRNKKLSPTISSDGVIPYEMRFMSGHTKYHIIVGDAAGEKFKEEFFKSGRYFHKTDYFKYIESCDIIFLCVDVDKTIECLEARRAYKDGLGGRTNQNDYIYDMQNASAAALTIMHQGKSFLPNKKKISFPVALLFLKTDELNDPEEKVQEWPHYDNRPIHYYFTELINFCKKKCLYSKMFYVSSFAEAHLVDKRLRDNESRTIDVLNWAIRHVKRTLRDSEQAFR